MPGQQGFDLWEETLDTTADRLLTMKYHIPQDARNYFFIMLQLNGTLIHLR